MVIIKTEYSSSHKSLKNLQAATERWKAQVSKWPKNTLHLKNVP